MSISSPKSEVFNEPFSLGTGRFPAGFFDLSLPDPPYFSGPERRGYYGQRESRIGIKRLYKKSDTWTLPTFGEFEEIRRVSKNYIFFGCNYFDFPFHSGRIVWDKVNDSSDYSDCEIAATDLFDHVRIVRYMWNGMLQGESATNGAKMQGNKSLNERRIHPTQKPVLLYKAILSKWAKPGMKILDTHMGSQSLRIACYDMGFDYWGWETYLDHFEAGNKRFAHHASQMPLFSDPALYFGGPEY